MSRLADTAPSEIQTGRSNPPITDRALHDTCIVLSNPLSNRCRAVLRETQLDPGK